MSKYEQEHVVNMSSFLKQDLAKLKAKTDNIEAQLQLKIDCIERYNASLHDFKLDLKKNTAIAFNALEDQKKLYWEFSSGEFEKLKYKSTALLKILCLVLDLGFDENTCFSDITNRMQTFQYENINESIESAIKEASKFDAKHSCEKIILSWLKNSLKCKQYKEKSQSIRETIEEITLEIQYLLQKVNKLTKLKEKFYQNSKIINKYLEAETHYTTSSTDTSCLSKRKPNTSLSSFSHIQRSHLSSEFESIKINHSDLAYKELHTSPFDNDPSPLIIEAPLSIGCFSFKLCCFN